MLHEVPRIECHPLLPILGPPLMLDAFQVQLLQCAGAALTTNPGCAALTTNPGCAGCTAGAPAGTTGDTLALHLRQFRLGMQTAQTDCNTTKLCNPYPASPPSLPVFPRGTDYRIL